MVLLCCFFFLIIATIHYSMCMYFKIKNVYKTNSITQVHQQKMCHYSIPRYAANSNNEVKYFIKMINNQLGKIFPTNFLYHMGVQCTQIRFNLLKDIKYHGYIFCTKNVSRKKKVSFVSKLN